MDQILVLGAGKSVLKNHFQVLFRLPDLSLALSPLLAYCSHAVLVCVSPDRPRHMVFCRWNC
ncbi:MAG: hypothetical protein DWH82_11725 [Planctomycetota bacterium]|nr:MAG: hypothetical protein DWH82_11725 [Planctomycetota bacterium]